MQNLFLELSKNYKECNEDIKHLEFSQNRKQEIESNLTYKYSNYINQLKEKTEIPQDVNNYINESLNKIKSFSELLISKKIKTKNMINEEIVKSSDNILKIQDIHPK